jgi:hypothetical protein
MCGAPAILGESRIFIPMDRCEFPSGLYSSTGCSRRVRSGIARASHGLTPSVGRVISVLCRGWEFPSATSRSRRSSRPLGLPDEACGVLTRDLIGAAVNRTHTCRAEESNAGCQPILCGTTLHRSDAGPRIPRVSGVEEIGGPHPVLFVLHGQLMDGAGLTSDHLSA